VISWTFPFSFPPSILAPDRLITWRNSHSAFGPRHFSFSPFFFSFRDECLQKPRPSSAQPRRRPRAPPPPSLSFLSPLFFSSFSSIGCARGLPGGVGLLLGAVVFPCPSSLLFPFSLRVSRRRWRCRKPMAILSLFSLFLSFRSPASQGDQQGGARCGLFPSLFFSTLAAGSLRVGNEGCFFSFSFFFFFSSSGEMDHGIFSKFVIFFFPLASGG